MHSRSLLLVIPLLWIIVTAFTEATGHPWSSNLATVRKLGQWIERFQMEQNRLPENLAELRTYVYSLGVKPDLYDSYGSRLAYLPLTEEAFIVKSYGRDMTENTALLSPDESFSHGLLVPPLTLKAEPSQESRLNFFQSAFLEGQDSPRGPLLASIRTRFRGDFKRLLIQSHRNPHFFMTSLHDTVDEFVWLPGGYELIFIAQGSKRYEDGIFYWNLQNNEFKNLLPEFKARYFPGLKPEQTMLLSLSHVGSKPDFIYFFAVPASADGIMDPEQFYRYRNFYALNPDHQFAAEPVAADDDFSIFDYAMSHRSLIETSSSALATPGQRAWTKLSLVGNKQDLLEAWQNYASTFPDSPQLPYALWWIASIYNDTYRELLVEHKDKARTLRNFGLEIAEALSSLPSAPPYLRAFAEHLKKNLHLSKPAGYNVVSRLAADAGLLETTDEDEHMNALPLAPLLKNEVLKEE